MPDAAQRAAELLAECFPDGRHWTAEEIDAVLKRPGGYLFENAGGALVVNAVLDEAEIWTIAVRPDQRRRGFARELITQAIEKLASCGVTNLYLEVAENNRAAQKLYSGLEFAETGRRQGYYRDAQGQGVDAILMTRVIGG